jgi:hypothetical protein
MKTRITMFLAVVCLVMVPYAVHARTYSFVREAIREYDANPNPETEARLHAAQRKAHIMDVSFWAVPLLLATYVVVRITIGRKTNESTQASE